MKLQELLMDIFSTGEYPKGDNRFGYVNETIYGNRLEIIKERILQSEEFSECEELIILKHPTVELDGKVKLAETRKLGENQKFKGRCYLLSLALTPEMFDPNKIHTTVLDGACITPTLYDPQTFQPKKKIVLEFSPEMNQEQILNGEETNLRKRLHKTLDKILDNPENYQVKGEKGVIVRGFFEEVVTPTSTYKTDLVGIETEKLKHLMVYFFETDEKNSKEGQVSLKLSSIPIPIELGDKFKGELGFDPAVIKREDIEEFLKRNQ
jgi:hypothetical protein